MTQRTARRLLWLTSILTLPVPFYLGEPELAPVVRLCFLSSLLSAVLAAEGGGTLALLAGLGIVQTLLYAALLWLAASLVARAAGHLRTPARDVAVVALAAALFAAALGPIYQTPLSSRRPRSNLAQIFD